MAPTSESLPFFGSGRAQVCGNQLATVVKEKLYGKIRFAVVEKTAAGLLREGAAPCLTLSLFISTVHVQPPNTPTCVMWVCVRV